MKKIILALLATAISAQAQHNNIITANLENYAVRRFMSEVKYTSTNDPSLINLYDEAPPERRDIPQPAYIPIPDVDAARLTLTYADDADFGQGVHTMSVGKGTQAEVYNLIPQHTYYYKVEADGENIASGEIHTEGRVRMIYVPGANNIRDMGGMLTTSGKRIKYGKLFRGSELNGKHEVDADGIGILTDDLGIEAEIDMRAFYDEGKGVSAFGFKSDRWGTSAEPSYYYTSDSGQLPEHLQNISYQRRWKQEFNFIVNNFVKARNVYYHCVWGADRTGYFSLLIEGLLGVDYDYMIKDYELTNFYTGINTKEKIDTIVKYIGTLKGNSLQEKFKTFFVDTLEVHEENIRYFINEMLEEEESVDNPTTAISTRSQALRSATTVDLLGRKTQRAGRKGIVIETAPDGTVRKVIR